jgi:hypothetical protein
VQAYPPVILDSPITAACSGKFGSNILVGTASGAVALVSWLGEILQLYHLVSASLPSPSMGGIMGYWEGNEVQSQPESEGPGIKSLSFSDTLQLLAMVQTDGTFRSAFMP